jgi:hypothetical protein
MTKEKSYTPTRTYEFEVKIGDLDYTADLYKINILTSVDVPYQTFILEFFLDPNDIILEKIYGQTPIKLTSRLFGIDPLLPQEEIVFDLMFIQSDHPMLMLVQNPEEIQKDRAPITITAVARDPFITMNTFVNNVFQGKTVEDAIVNIMGNTNASLKYDQNGKNAEVIDQILVPPSTLYQCIKYLNRTFGIFNGIASIFTLYDNSHKFTFWQLALDADNTKIITKTDDGISFYTKSEIQTGYKGNSVFAVLAPNMKHIVKPGDRLSYTFDTNLEQFSKEYGLVSKSNKIFYDSKAISSKRVKVYKDHTGYELNKSFINASISQKIANITDMSVRLENSLHLLNLMHVGEAVLFNSKVGSVNDLTGKYILRASELSFQKAKDWESSATLYLSRTNRIIN